MAFPRQFNKQVWYLQIPSGEIEIATSEALKSAYKCGLVDLRTPVRAFGTHAWQTMQEAAEIELPQEPSIVSITPVAMSAPPPALEEAMARQSRVDIDPEAFKPSRKPAFFTALGVAACALAFVLGRGNTLKNARASAAMMMDDLGKEDMELTTVKPMTLGDLPRTPRVPREQVHSSVRYDGQRFSKDEKLKLAELDWVTRTQRPKNAIIKPLLPSKAPPVTSEDPFARSGRAGDPLDGTL